MESVIATERLVPLPSRAAIRHIEWTGRSLRVLDQRRLPAREAYLECRTAEAVAEAIRSMALRGAPLIGCAAAYGMALAARAGGLKDIERSAALLKKARPTAVNLAHAVDAMLRSARRAAPRALFREVAAAAVAYYKEDLEANRRMARLGAALLPPRARVITYCNAGTLATSGMGTALGVIRQGWRDGRVSHVYPCETRPYLQGSRLTLWELMKEGIPSTLITDNMAAHLMRRVGIDAVIVGADRIAANADVANKIGTYALAIVARHHGVPLYVAAPTSTVDLATPTGEQIPIEERSAEEVLLVGGRPIAPAGARARHFAFDVTPHKLVAAIVTEKGVVKPVNGKNLRKVFQ